MPEPVEHGGCAQDVIESLAHGELPRVFEATGIPPAAIDVFTGVRDPGTLDPGERRDALSSWLSAGVLSRLASHMSPGEVCSAARSLPLPPLGLHLVLDRILDGTDPVDPGLLVHACSRLEVLLNVLEPPFSPRLAGSLGLPSSLGRLVDAIVVAVESGAVPPRSPSAAHPFLLTLDRLAVPSVWDLLPSAGGAIAHRAAEFSLDVLASSVEALNLIGAPATSLRMLVLLLLLVPPPRVEPSQRRLLTRLLLSGASSVPAERVLDVWSLANRGS